MTDDSADETGAGRLAAFGIKNSVMTFCEIRALGGPTSTYIFADGTSSVVEFRLNGSACMQASVGTGTLQDMSQTAVTCAGSGSSPASPTPSPTPRPTPRGASTTSTSAEPRRPDCNCCESGLEAWCGWWIF